MGLCGWGGGGDGGGYGKRSKRRSKKKGGYASDSEVQKGKKKSSKGTKGALKWKRRQARRYESQEDVGIGCLGAVIAYALLLGAHAL